jgi:hypothetical protein
MGRRQSSYRYIIRLMKLCSDVVLRSQILTNTTLTNATFHAGLPGYGFGLHAENGNQLSLWNACFRRMLFEARQKVNLDMIGQSLFRSLIKRSVGEPAEGSLMS